MNDIQKPNDLQKQEATLALSQILQDATDEFKAKILNTIVITGISPKDPLFLFLATLFPLKYVLEDAPKEVRAAAANFLEEMQKHQESYKHLEETIKEATKEATSLALLGETKPENWKALVGGALAAGLIAGFGIFKITSPAVDPNGARHLTLDQAVALEWATGPQGRLAKNLVEWNGDYLKSGECERDVRQFNQDSKNKLTLTLGNRVAKDGFCLLWVKPYGQRNFQ